MSHLFYDPQRSLQFLRAFQGHEIDFKELMKGYGSTVDAPTEEFYEKIHQVYPKAKLILTIRDNGCKWFESIKNTIGPMGIHRRYLILFYPIRFLRLQCLVNRKLFQRWIENYGSFGPQIHDLHNQRIINENSKENLLIYNVKEAWEPLCEFLHVPIPNDIPFPNINDTKYLQHIFFILKLFATFVWICILLFISIFIYCIFRFIAFI
ncbi:unnamed protein product [Adineta ricciae]|uniref:Uncharacterized protein n=1 Tax=Adineta ricciae TaxID=249248 RepID=A0A815JSV3_ADIRI|nr:unnamed protein product [Adineta ricciae]